MRVKNWNRMPNAVYLGGIDVKTTHECIDIWNLTTYVFLSHVRDICMKSVTF